MTINLDTVDDDYGVSDELPANKVANLMSNPALKVVVVIGGLATGFAISKTVSGKARKILNGIMFAGSCISAEWEIGRAHV